MPDDDDNTPDPKIAELEAKLAAAEQKTALQLVSQARLQALVDFPLADKEVINLLTEPEVISAQAERTHKANEAHRTELEAAKQQQRQGTGVTPSPPANSDAASTEAEAKYQRMARQVKHPSARRQVDVLDAELFQEQAFKRAWNSHMGQRKEAGLRTQPVPET